MHSITRSEFKAITSALCRALRIHGPALYALEEVARNSERVAVGSFVDGCPVEQADLRPKDGQPLDQVHPELMAFACGFDAYIDERFHAELVWEVEIIDG